MTWHGWSALLPSGIDDELSAGSSRGVLPIWSTPRALRGTSRRMACRRGVRYCTTIDFPGNRLGRTVPARACIVITAANIVTTFVECGPIECPDDPTRAHSARSRRVPYFVDPLPGSALPSVRRRVPPAAGSRGVTNAVPAVPAREQWRQVLW
jgi:hypothetical protein